MKLVLLGTGGYFPTAKRHTACVVLPEVGVVLDAGTGMYRLRKHIQTEQLDIFLSHAHLDHVAGLTYLINIVPQPVLKHTTVYGDQDQLDAVREHIFAPEIFPVAPPFQMKPLNGAHKLPGGGTLTHFPLEHPGGSIGYRLDWPSGSMAYVTDTTASLSAGYIEHIRGVDLLLHESNFAEEDDNGFAAKIGHSWLEAAVDVAAAANVRRLLIVHIDPQIEDDSVFDLQGAREKFRNIEIGYDEMELEF